MGFTALGFSSAVAVAGWLTTLVRPDLYQLGDLLAFLMGLVALRPVCIAFHEGGHAITAAAVGLRVYRVIVGTGLIYKTFRVGSALLVIGRDLAGGGMVLALPPRRKSRWRQFAFVLAGPIGSIVGALFLMFLAGAVGAMEGATTAWSGAIVSFLAGGAAVSLAYGVASLIPRHSTIDGSRFASDGLQLLRLFWRQPPQPDWEHLHDVFMGADLLQTKRWREAEDHYRRMFSNHPDEPGYLAAQMHVAALADGPEAAMTCLLEHQGYLRTGAADEAHAPSWAALWGNAAWVIVRCPNGDLTLAEEFAARAVEADSTSPYSGSVQAAVQIRSGQRADNLDVILRSLKHMASPSDKLEFCDFIVAEGLESAELKRPDFEAYAAHLRALA